MILYTNIADCYGKLGLYEDVLLYCEKSLELDCTDFKALYLKAQALASLLEFEESINIYEVIYSTENIEKVKILEKMHQGDYSYVDVDYYLKGGQILNYINGCVQVKITEKKGRGLFAAEDLNEGQLLIVDQAIAQATSETGDAKA